MTRRIVWYSCGIASAVSAKMILEKYDSEVEIVYCNTAKSEHPDNYRFRADCERWLGRRIWVISSKKYDTVDEVFTARRYMSGPKGAICTTEMKKVPRFEYQQPDDIHIFGFTADKRERKRIRDFEKRNPELRLEWPLAEAGITKDDCETMIRDAGIRLPVLYTLGFKNNNCLWCVKATSPAYWNKVRKHFPGVFRRRCEQSRAIGCKLVRYQKKRIFLDELPPDVDLFAPQEENISCGPECGQVA